MIDLLRDWGRGVGATSLVHMEVFVEESFPEGGQSGESSCMLRSRVVPITLV
jgi:hypothetical protein